MPVVTIFSRGEKALTLEEKIQGLKEKFKDEIEFRQRYSEVHEPSSQELRIEILGFVTAIISFIKLLIEKLFDKNEDTSDVKIQIIHQDFNVSFNLPSDKEKCIEHFERFQKMTV